MSDNQTIDKDEHKIMRKTILGLLVTTAIAGGALIVSAPIALAMGAPLLVAGAAAGAGTVAAGTSGSLLRTAIRTRRSSASALKFH